MKLQDLGYNEALADYRQKNNLDSFEVGRVTLEHKDRYQVKTENSEYEAELLGNLRYTADDRYDLPAVGDWVAISSYDENKALIHAIYPRHSILERQAVASNSQIQIIACNIDFAFIVQSVNRDFSINRLERYLSICNSAKIKSVIILNKIDLVDEIELENLLSEISERIKDVPILPLSNYSNEGLEAIQNLIESGKTYCLLGSSGVGKSTLLNNLSGIEIMETGEISESIDRGKHVTSHRELIVLENGGIIIDNPGMREVGLTNSSVGLESTFEEILEISQNCKFNNCTHTNEKDCAVIEALNNGEIDNDSFANFSKMLKEKAFFESSLLERKKKDKDLGKLIKEVKKIKKRTKY